MGFAEGTLTFQEFAVKEPLPLSVIQEAVLEFLRGRDDTVVYGAQAVNAYVDEPRMTQGTDWRDIAMLLLAFPHLKKHPGPVTKYLVASSADSSVLETWKDIVSRELRAEEEDEGF